MMNASDLLETLRLYSLCIEEGFYAKEKKEKADNLKIVMDELIKKIENGSNIQDFNFKKFRRDIAFLYHPDMFSDFPEDMKINADSLFATFNGSLEELEKATKSNTPVKETDEDLDEHFDFNFKTTTSTAERKWAYSSERKNTTYETYTEEKRKKDEYAWCNPFPNHPYKSYYTLVDIIKEKYEYFFLGKPSDSEQYLALKTRYERKIKYLTNRLQRINTTITLLKRKEKRILDNLTADTTVDSIREEYDRQRNEVYYEVLQTRAKVAENRTELGRIRAKHSPEVEERKMIWDREKYQLQLMYSDVYFRYTQALTRGYIPEELYNEFNSTSQKFSQYSRPDDEVCKEIESQILAKDKNYLSSYRIYTANVSELQRFNSKLDYLLNNATEVQDTIYEERKKRYGQLIEENNSDINKAQRKKSKIENKLENVKSKYENLVATYTYFEKGKRR